MKINENVLNILKESKIEENKLYLPPMQLDRNTYLEVNKVLEIIEGKWNRKEKAHIFPENVEDILADIIDSGEIVDKKKELQFFETPINLVKQLIDLAEIDDNSKILEPSCGKGAILKEIEKQFPELIPENVFGNDINKKFLDDLGNRFNLSNEDFLNIDNNFYNGINRIIANPPFSKQQDIKHILKMYEILNSYYNSNRNNWVLVSIASAGITFRETKLAKELRAIIEKEGEIIKLPEGSFKESGTMVNTVIVKIKRGE